MIDLFLRRFVKYVKFVCLIGGGVMGWDGEFIGEVLRVKVVGVGFFY